MSSNLEVCEASTKGFVLLLHGIHVRHLDLQRLVLRRQLLHGQTVFRRHAPSLKIFVLLPEDVNGGEQL